MSVLDLEQFVHDLLRRTLADLRQNPDFADLKILDLHSSIDEGPDGQSALWIWVVLNDPPRAFLTPDRLRPVISAILDGIKAHGMQFQLALPVHITFQLKSELRQRR